MKQTTSLQADRMSKIPSYIFKEIDALKAARSGEGRPVIDLAMGNPVDPTPSSVIGTLRSKVVQPENHRYPASSGMDELKKEISRWYRDEHQVELDPSGQVICTIGSKEGISHLLLALVDRNDYVLVPSPSFPVHAYGAIIAGAQIQKLAVCDEKLFLEEVEKNCKEHPVSLVLLNYPHNPTGKVVELDFFYQMVGLAKKYGFFIIHDFAYSKLTYDSFKAPSFLQAEGAFEVGVEFGTFSKTFNMAGWRMGYCVGNARAVSLLSRIKGYFDYGIFSPIQYAGITALQSCREEVKRQVERYKRRRDVVYEKLKNAGYELQKPLGGMFCWSKIPPSFTGSGSQAFTAELFSKTGVIVTPGKAFGEEGDGFFRIALVEHEEVMAEAMELLVTEYPG